MKGLSKTELTRLTRVARSLPWYRVGATEAQFVCPLDHEARRREGDRTVSHRFSVVHLPWESGTTVAAVREALSRHLDPGWKSCSRVVDNSQTSK